MRLTRFSVEGKIVEKGESTWTTRYLFKDEAVHLLRQCGVTVESLVGDYMNGPLTEKGQLIFDARLSDDHVT